MESIPRNCLLEFNESTLQDVRALYGLEKLDRLNQALDILEEWVKKQEHFNRRDFSRDYLERRLMGCKGSIEKTKNKLDKYCTLRTMLPSFFKKIDLKAEFKYSEEINHGLLPKLTEDHDRIYVYKVKGTKFDHSYTNYCRFVLQITEYTMAYDYSKSLICIYDYTDASLLELTKRIDLVEVRQMTTILTEGYGHRIKGIHIITPSKAAETLVSLFKQFLSSKISNAIHIHKDYTSLHKYVPKASLPEDLGGLQKPVKELHDQWVDILSGEEFQNVLQEMDKATTNEAYRQKDTFNDSYMGMPGSFRTLTVD